jgi:sulfur relay (sulfurtransferase) DsrC/TusE family protein
MTFKPINSIYQNWSKDLYIATKDRNNITYDENNNEIVKYNEPFYFGKVNYQPLTRKDLEAYIKQYGETNNNIVSCLIDYVDDGKFQQLDLAYLYGVTPENELQYGDNANYIVRSYKPQNTKIMVIFEELVKEEN